MKTTLTAIALAALAGCATNPATGKSEFSVSEAWRHISETSCRLAHSMHDKADPYADHSAQCNQQ